MNLKVIEASMTHNEEEGFIGRVLFQLGGQPTDYEITFYSQKGKDWGYSLSFGKESGKEEDIVAIEEMLEQDDDLFDSLLHAAKSSQTDGPV